ncbi:MAG TPA: MarR family transcriptional regulator [Polyangiales bacterium]|nr:MarR family transcriptional regulator [Polyangiales bacterium]
MSRAFDAALAEVGGSLPLWLVVLELKSGGHAAQRELAEAIGIEGATLTHHLNRMEEEQFIVRRRDPENRRVQLVSLTETGEQLFQRLLARVIAFDRQLRAGLSEEALAHLRAALDVLERNVSKSSGNEEGGETS